jgi:phosphatidylserine/phosphatidylglycerophosphate/cardiolipin synthase-like enzyme
MGIDSDMIITGSVNFTQTTQDMQVENVLPIHDQALAVQYTQIGEAHRRHNRPHVGRGERR